MLYNPRQISFEWSSQEQRDSRSTLHAWGTHPLYIIYDV